MYFRLFYEINKASTETYLIRMTNNFKTIALIIFGIIALIIFQIKHSNHNLNKTISACVVAQKQTSKSFNLEESKKFCKDKITKSLNK